MNDILQWFTKDYDFYKGVLVGSLFAILTFGILFLFQYQAFAELDELVGTGKKVQAEDLRQLYMTADAYETLNNEVQRDETLTSVDNIKSHLEKAAFRSGLGGLNRSEKLERNTKKGYQDRTVTVKLRDKDLIVTRDQVKNFFFSIEERTNRVQVTAFKLHPPSNKQGFVSGEIRPDNWILKDCRVVARSRMKK